MVSVFLVALLLGTLLSAIFFILIHRQTTKNLDARNSALTALRRLDEIMMASLGLEDVAQKVTDAIAFELKFEIGVLALVDERHGILRRVAMSRTPVGLKTHEYLPIPYTQISISLNQKDNLMIQVLTDGQRRITHRLYDVLRPVLNEATSDKIQSQIGIKNSLVYPVSAKGKRIGIMIISFAKEEKQLSDYQLEMIDKLVDAMGIALDNARVYQKLRDTTQQLAQANQKLRELDQLKDDFVSVASHELRTPMTAIRSYVWMALHRSDIPLSQKLERYLYRTLVSTERLINLVNDMLNVSRIEAGSIEINPKPFNILELVGEVIEEVQIKADEKQLHLSLLQHPVPLVFGDPDKIHEVLLNLIGNALKFTFPGGSITVDFFTDGKVVEIAVKDNGAGMVKEDLSRLFKKFGRLDNSYVATATSGGTGLGLYISKNLVELMRGKIWARSEGLNKGSTFIFSLPVASKQIVSQAEKFHIRPIGEAKELEPVAI